MFSTTAVRPTTMIEDWLVERVADYTERAARDVDPVVPLAELGLDSVSAVNLCGEIEDRWSLEVDPVLVFEYPTIADIAAYIATESALAG
jgi:acyl carrier protein